MGGARAAVLGSKSVGNSMKGQDLVCSDLASTEKTSGGNNDFENFVI
jgi:hypothetical protein